jgi:2-dehydro-3-deoxyphosphogluconate aldolase/(4S)-4-hydroxy-2-oxoglutarate aldolase
MEREVWFNLLRQHRAIAVIRSDQIEQGWQMAQAVAAAGMRLIEITWNSDRPTSLIEKCHSLPNCIIGAGTILTPTQLQQAIAAGAQFLFSPHVNLELLQQAQAQNIPFVPGALTPTEIVTAWQAGATGVKVFPIQSLGGASYIQHLRAPLGDIPLIPTGGVTVENATCFLQAGAIAVGLSSVLFPKQAIAQGDWQQVTQQAQQLLNNIRLDTPDPGEGGFRLRSTHR